MFFEELGIPAPKRHLGVGSGSHGTQTGALLEALELAMPEEIHRLVTDRLSRLFFASTDEAVAQLRRECISGTAVGQVDDVMFDAALKFAARACHRCGILERFGLVPGGYILATIHRAENTDSPSRIASILEGLANVGREIPMLLPIHRRARRILADRGQLDPLDAGEQVVDPVGYLGMIRLEQSAALIATDSSDVQKEAFFHQVPRVTLRAETRLFTTLRVCGIIGRQDS